MSHSSINSLAFDQGQPKSRLLSELILDDNRFLSNSRHNFKGGIFASILMAALTVGAFCFLFFTTHSFTSKSCLAICKITALPVFCTFFFPILTELSRRKKNNLEMYLQDYDNEQTLSDKTAKHVIDYLNRIQKRMSFIKKRYEREVKYCNIQGWNSNKNSKALNKEYQDYYNDFEAIYLSLQSIFSQNIQNNEFKTLDNFKPNKDIDEINDKVSVTSEESEQDLD